MASRRLTQTDAKKKEENAMRNSTRLLAMLIFGGAFAADPAMAQFLIDRGGAGGSGHGHRLE